MSLLRRISSKTETFTELFYLKSLLLKIKLPLLKVMLKDGFYDINQTCT